jgi:hypothetical protein
MRTLGSQRATAAVIVVFLTSVLSLLAHTHSSAPKEASMIQHAVGPFDVKMHPQDDKEVDGVTRLLLDKQYHRDLEGTAKGQMLTGGMSADKSGVYVAIEKFVGSLQGRSGSFVLCHTGIMTRGKPELTILIAPDSGTGQLVGITGKMTIIIAADGKHSYDFEYTLPTVQ